MKNFYPLAARRLLFCGIISTILFSNTALAMGGEFIAGLIVVQGGILIIWLITTILSSITIKEWGLRVFLPIALSYPLYIFWSFAIAPSMERREVEQNTEHMRVVTENATQEFGAACTKHVARATQVMYVTETSRPKSVYVDDYDTQLGLNLANCVTKKSTPACGDIGFAFVEKSYIHGKPFAPCKNGLETNTPFINEQCRREFSRYDFGETNFKVVEINEPVSDFVVRVGGDTDISKERASVFERVSKYPITLESAQTGQILARTEILLSAAAGIPCPIPEEEVAEMILKVFPQR